MSKYPDFDGTQACAKVDPEMFFFQDDMDRSERAINAQYKAAIEVCKSCSWTSQCLEYAVDVPWLSGVWGGTTERQRARIRLRKRVS